jgi:hypothetical protein
VALSDEHCEDGLDTSDGSAVLLKPRVAITKYSITLEDGAFRRVDC